MRKKIVYSENVKEFPDCKCLILAPHSDDEWIGCSQIVLKCNDVLICNMDMPGGDSVAIHQIRYNEMSFLANRYNRKIITVDANCKTDSLLKIVRDYHPEVIMLPFFKDWHDEHIEVMRCLKSISKNLDDVLIGMYAVSLPIPSSSITHCNILNASQQKEKWLTFKDVYRSQKCIQTKRFAANERINGAYVGAFAAEVYSVMPCERWNELFDQSLLNDDEKRIFKLKLNEIGVVRKLLE